MVPVDWLLQKSAASISYFVQYLLGEILQPRKMPPTCVLSLLPEPSLTLETGIHENSLKNPIRSYKKTR